MLKSTWNQVLFFVEYKQEGLRPPCLYLLYIKLTLIIVRRQ